MSDTLSKEATRFKKVREELGFTQSEMAKALEMKGSTADIERSKTKITGRVVTLLLQKYGINPLWLYGFSFNKNLDPSGGTGPKVVSLDTHENENMIMVPIKASAGYAANVQDVDWYNELPAFNIPLPQYQGGSYRSFQVRGDSMLPTLQPGEWVMARAVESVPLANNNRVHVVILADSVLVKKLHKTEDPSKVDLISLNKDYPVITTSVDSITELWEVNSKLSFDIDASENEGDALISLKAGLDSLRDEIAALKGKA